MRRNLPNAVTCLAVRPVRNLAFGALLGLAVAASQAWGATESTFAARKGFNFAVLADKPASDRDELLTRQILAQIAREADLVLHAGNLKSGAERCDDELYTRRKQLLNDSPVPLVPTPGEHDWTSCDQPAAGSFGPAERLSRLRELFFESRSSFGELKLDLQRQSDTARYRNYPENARWEYGGVLFVTLNIPANSNNYQSGAGRNGEYEERSLANSFWVRQAFNVATREKQKAIVMVFDADPDFEGRQNRAASDGRDPYAEFKATLTRLAVKFPGQVLLLHGTNDGTARAGKPDQPLRSNGKPVENVTRIQAMPPSNEPAWLKVIVEPGRKGQFRFESRRLGQPPRQP